MRRVEEEGNTELRQEDNEHSIEELAVLSVDFSPWYLSTHGLSRPATPVKDDLPRFVSL